MKLTHIASICLVSALSLAIAQDAAAPAAVQAAAPAEAVPAELQATPQATAAVEAEDILDWSERIQEQYGLDDWGEKNGKIFSFQYQTVLKKATDPEFGRAITTAFDLAMAKAQQDIVMLRFGHLVTEKAREFFHDGSTNAREIPVEAPSAKTPAATIAEKQMAVLDKSLDVEGARLDKELVELGAATPAQVAQMPVVQKKTLFKEAFTKKILKQASGDISGIVPIQTTVKIKTNGEAVVGVVVVLSDKTIQVAKDIAAQRPTFIKGAPRELKTMKPATDAEKIGNLGVRLVYDQDGLPTIVSYGIAAYVPDGTNSYINSTLEENARQQAKDNADAQIAEMVNGYMSAEQCTQSGQEIERTIEREMKQDSMTYEKEAEAIVNVVRHQMRATASIRMQGISSLASGRAKLPSGQIMFYAIRVWKYSTLQAVQQFNMRAQGIQPPPAPAPAAPAPVQHPIQGQNLDGRKFNTVEDF